MIYFDKFVDLVEARGGMMITTEENYVHSGKNEVQCANGHTFETNINSLRTNRWCAKCNLKLGELISLSVLEFLTDKKFVKIRPAWLKYIEGGNLELDMYNEELKLAVEYNGIQHYKYIPFFHRETDGFAKLQASDAFKASVCKERNVNLIIIPYTVKMHDIPSFIIEKCKALEYKFNYLAPMPISNFLKQRCKLDDITELVERRHGTVVEIPKEINHVTDIKLKCKEGHEWITTLKYLKRGFWCKICGFKLSDERKEKIAKGMKRKRGGDENEVIKHVKTETLYEKPCAKCLIVKSIDSFSTKGKVHNHICKNCDAEMKRIKRRKEREAGIFYQCENCDKKYTLKDSLAKHVTKVHKL
jgi:hypothetical protein